MNAFAAQTLKVGAIGVMSGAAASWGLVIKYSVEAVAKMFNEEGGVLIDGKRYKIEVVSADTKMDPRLAKTAAERLVYQEKVKYMVGPCMDDTTAAVQPVLEAAGAIDVSYAFDTKIFSAPHYNTILGMIAPYTSAPVIYKYMMDKYGIKTVAFVSRNDADALFEKKAGMEAAKQLGLEILSWKDTYEPDTVDFFPVMTKVISKNPDQIVLSGVSPGEAPLMLTAARQLGYKGQMTCETSHDIKILNEVAGKYAEGFGCVGGASTPEMKSEYMDKFVKTYTEIAGEWNDEAGTKCYALTMLLYTLQKAGEKALTDVEVFKDAIPSVKVRNPFLKEEKVLKYVGAAYFKQPRQIGVPLVIIQVKNGKFETLLVETEY
jgi:branched-chain amino acid transport system substrate-binding protein